MVCSIIFTGTPLASCRDNTIDKTTREKISLITAAVIIVLPSLVSNSPNCIRTIVVTGTAVIDNNNPTNIDWTIPRPKRAAIPKPLT